MYFSDRLWYSAAVILYGGCTVYSIFLYRKGFRQDDRINYGLLLIAFCLHTLAMVQRGFSLNRCPINNLYEATLFINWTILAAYLPIGAWPRLRFLGVFAAPILFGLGVFAMMPGMDVKSAAPTFSGGWASLHKSLILLSYGAFGLSCVAALMYLTQEHDLKFHKLRAVLSLLPPMQRLERVISRLLVVGFAFLTAGLVVSAVYLKRTHGVYVSADALLLYCLLVWVLYLALLVLRWGYAQRGRRMAWGSVIAFAFVVLTFWGVFLLSRIHNPADKPPPASSIVPDIISVKLFRVVSQNSPSAPPIVRAAR